MKERERKFSKSKILAISLALLFSLGLVLVISLEGRIGRGNIFTSDFWNLIEEEEVRSEVGVVTKAYAVACTYYHPYCGWTGPGKCRAGTSSSCYASEFYCTEGFCCESCCTESCGGCTAPGAPTGYQAVTDNGCTTTTTSCTRYYNCSGGSCGTTTATYEKIDYTVTINPNGGSCSGNQNICYQLGSTAPSCTRSGYSLTNYSITSGSCAGTFTASTGVCSKVEGAMTIQANWTPTDRTVTYTRNNPSAGSLSYYSKAVNYGSSSTPGPTVTTNTGYIFNNFVIISGSCAGTFTASTGVCSNVQEEMTIQANWSLISYTLTYTRNNTLGGELGYYSKNVNYGSSSTPGPTVTTSTGYDFNNFTITSGTCAGTFDASTGVCSNVQGNITIQANWSIKTFTVQYDGNGGTCTPSSRIVDYGSTAAPPSCTREGYSLVSFVRSVGSGGILDILTGSVSNVTGNQTIRAEWASSDLSGYQYKKAISISNNTTYTRINEDVLITIDTQTLIAQGHMKNGCEDIRFYDGSSLLTYWIEGKCNTTTTQIWVRIPSIPPISEIVIFMHYGNPSATSGSLNWSGNVVSFADTTCPTGWTRVSAMDGKFIYGSETYGQTGGTSSHAHDDAIGTSSSISSTNVAGTSSGGTAGTTTSHTHTSLKATISTNSSVLPPYRDMVMCAKNGFDFNSGLISMFSSSAPTGWTRYSNLDNRLPRAASAYGGSGGSATHTHSTGVGSSTSAPTGTGATMTAPLDATGGTITSSGGYKIHSFTSSGTFTPNQAGTIDLLVVAGGGGGALDCSGGGGAGGVRYLTSYAMPAGSKTITVGAGGAAHTNGENSSFGGLVTCIGGGAGNKYKKGNDGGSGGGGSYLSEAGQYEGGNGTTGQGNYGGQGKYNYRGGGGGGAGGPGGNGNQGGNGGVGIEVGITGSSVYYGGGGGASSTSTVGTGGLGGGGNGNGSSGQANTGGGGGGVRTGTPGSGGSGVVIIRYPTPAAANGSIATSNHTHTIASATVSSVSNEPPYQNFVFAKANSNTYVTSNNILIVSTLPPLGYTRYSDLDDRFARGATSYGTLGGTTTHTHSVTITTGGASASLTAYGTGTNFANNTHTHSTTVTTNSESNIPPYYSVIYTKRKSSLEATTLPDVRVTYTKNIAVAGSLNPDYEDVAYGASSTETEVTTNTGYAFNNFTITSGTCDGDFFPSTGVCTDVREALTIRANWKIRVTYLDTPDERGSLNPTYRDVEYGASAAGPTATPTAGWVLKQFSISSGSCAGTFTSSTGTCTNVQVPITIVAQWENLAPSFTAFSNNGPVSPGETITFSSTSSDPGGGNVTLLVCKTAGLTGATCDGGAFCTSLPSTSNASCSYFVPYSSPGGSINAYPYILDEENLGATGAFQGSNRPFVVSSIAPEVQNIIINGGSAISLAESDTIDIEISTTITNGHGCTQTDNVKAYLYRSGVGYSNCDIPGKANANNCYPEITCVQDVGSCTGGSDITASYTCTVPMEYYADPTDSNTEFSAQNWKATIKATGTNSLITTVEIVNGVEVNSLLAMRVLDEYMIYSPILAGESNATLNTTITSIPTGNVGLDQRHYGDNKGMCTNYPTCTGGTPIPISSQRYSTTPSTPYSSGTPLSSTATLVGLKIPKMRGGTLPSKLSYWGISIPLGTKPGEYEGRNYIDAVKSSVGDW